MNNTLFDPPITHRDDPISSYEAGQKKIDSGALNNQEETVFIIIRIYLSLYHTNFTAKDIIGHGVDYKTIQRRLSGLHRKGKIERTGEKRNGCCVWRLK